jgi:hypothetical protein
MRGVVLHGRVVVYCPAFAARIRLLMGSSSPALDCLVILVLPREQQHYTTCKDAQPFAGLEQLGSWNCRRCNALTTITRPR